MKTYRFSKVKDNLILLICATFLAVTIVWSIDYLDISMPWETPTFGPPSETYRTLRTYA